MREELKVGDLVGYYKMKWRDSDHRPYKQLISHGLVTRIQQTGDKLGDLISKYYILWNKYDEELDSLFYGKHDVNRSQVYACWQVDETIKKL